MNLLRKSTKRPERKETPPSWESKLTFREREELCGLRSRVSDLEEAYSLSPSDPLFLNLLEAHSCLGRKLRALKAIVGDRVLEVKDKYFGFLVVENF